MHSINLQWCHDIAVICSLNVNIKTSSEQITAISWHHCRLIECVRGWCSRQVSKLQLYHGIIHITHSINLQWFHDIAVICSLDVNINLSCTLLIVKWANNSDIMASLQRNRVRERLLLMSIEQITAILTHSINLQWCHDIAVICSLDVSNNLSRTLLLCNGGWC
jgi:hypothetical protein